MANNKIMFDVGFKVDKSGLDSLQKSLNSLGNLKSQDLMKINNTSIEQAREDLASILRTSARVNEALRKAFNPKLGTISFQGFNKNLQDSGLSIKYLETELAKAGATGQATFRNIANTLTSTNTQFKQTHVLAEKMMTTLTNTIKWNMASAAVNAMTRNISSAVSYVEHLDSALNSIQIVTEKSAEDMDKFAKNANKAAQALGSTTVAYTKGALTFYQQGLNDEEVQARTDLTTKVQNVTGLSAEDSAEYVTSVLNGYKVGSEQAEAAMDKLAAVGAHTASSLAELSEGMAKVASSANAMGVTEDQLAATLSTVISVTRQDASSVGTAFKTIYARMSAIKAGTDEAEVSLGQYTQKMKEVGINVLDSSGQLRDMGEVMEEIGGKWGTMTREQQLYLAQTMAGTRQYNNLIALFDNWGAYMDSLNVSMASNGTLQRQQDIYMESTAAHLKQMKAASEGVYDSILDADSIDAVATVMTGLLKTLETFIDGIGGGSGVITAFGALFFNVFSKKIAGSIMTTIENSRMAKQQMTEMNQAYTNVLNIMRESGNVNDPILNSILKTKESLFELVKTGEITEEQFKKIQESATNLTSASGGVDKLREELQLSEQAAQSVVEKFTDLRLTKAITGVKATEKFNVKNLNAEQQQNTANLILGQVEGAEIAGSKKYSLLQDSLNKIKEIKNEISKSPLDLKTENAKENIDKVKQEIIDLNKQTKEFNRGKALISNEEIQKMNSLSKTASQSSQDFKKFRESVVTLSSSLGQKLNIASKEAEEGLAALQGGLKAQHEELKQAEEDLAFYNNELQNLSSEAALQAQISSISKMVGGINQLAFGLQSLINLKDIFKDGINFDSMLQGVIGITMGLPMLINGFNAFNKSINSINGLISMYTTKGVESNILLLKSEQDLADERLLSAINAFEMAEGEEVLAAERELNAALLNNETIMSKRASLQRRLEMIERGGLVALIKSETAAI